MLALSEAGGFSGVEKPASVFAKGKPDKATGAGTRVYPAQRGKGKAECAEYKMRQRLKSVDRHERAAFKMQS